MTNRPKDIGTAGETAVVKYLRDNGFPGAERRALAGTHDLGDLIGLGPVVVEVKAGKAAENASSGQVEAWMVETETERKNARADIGVLVLKRKGVGDTRTGLWWAYLPARTVVGLLDPGSSLDEALSTAPAFTVRLTLADAVRALRWGGYGDPLDEVAA